MNDDRSEATDEMLEDALEDAVESALDDALEDAVEDAIEDAIEDAVDDAVEEAVDDEIEDAFDDTFDEDGPEEEDDEEEDDEEEDDDDEADDPPRAAPRVVVRRGARSRHPSLDAELPLPPAPSEARHLGTERGAPPQVLRCPICQADAFEFVSGIASCTGCGRQFPARGRVIDLVGDRVAPPSPAQRVMQLRFYAEIYERWSRPAFTRFMAGREVELEMGLAVDMLALHTLTEPPLVLDVACGPGNFTRRFASVMRDPGLSPPNGVVFGLDLSRSMLRRAAQEARAATYDNTFFVRGDALSMPFQSDSFDRVHCSAALHLFDEPLVALREFARVLKPAGEVVVSTFVTSQIPTVHAAQRLAGRLTGVQLFEPARLKRMLRKAGLGKVGEARNRYALTLRLALDSSA